MNMFAMGHARSTPWIWARSLKVPETAISDDYKTLPYELQEGNLQRLAMCYLHVGSHYYIRAGGGYFW